MSLSHKPSCVSLQSSLLWQGNGPASVGSLFPILLLTQNVFPSLTKAMGMGSAHTAWPAPGPVLKLAPGGSMQFSLFFSQSLIEGHGNWYHPLSQEALGHVLWLDLSPSLSPVRYNPYHCWQLQLSILAEKICRNKLLMHLLLLD